MDKPTRDYKKRARIPNDLWQEARERREAGDKISAIAAWLEVDQALVSRKAKQEGWGNGIDLEGIVHRKVTERAVKRLAGNEKLTVAQSIDIIAQRRADVEERHQDEWAQHKPILDEAINQRDFDLAKLAKMTAETIIVRQNGERKAWHLDGAPQPVTHNTATIINNAIGSSEEFAEIARKLVLDV